MVEKFQETGVFSELTSSAIWLSTFSEGWLPSNGITKPMPASPEGMAPSAPHMALVPVSDVTHQLMKSSVAWMLSSEAFLFTHQ